MKLFMLVKKKTKTRSTITTEAQFLHPSLVLQIDGLTTRSGINLIVT